MACETGGGAINAPIWEISGALEATTECPKSLITADSVGWLMLYRMHESGKLPLSAKSGYGSGIYEQPNNYLSAICLIGEKLTAKI